MPLFRKKRKTSGRRTRTGRGPFAGLKNLFAKKKRDAEKTASFRPSRHGYAFTNSFSVSDIVDDLPPDLRRRVPARTANETYGLCGGMTFSACDFFEAGVRRPAATSAPRTGTPLYRFIKARQLDSFGVAFRQIVRVLEWMGADDAKVQKRTAKQVRTVVEKLQAGKFAPLYLIRTSGGAPWKNHQVVAYGYRDRTARDGCVELKIYDPNYRNDDGQVVEVRFLSPDRVVCRQLRAGTVLPKEPVRGFFTRPYTAKVRAARRVS